MIVNHNSSGLKFCTALVGMEHGVEFVSVEHSTGNNIIREKLDVGHQITDQLFLTFIHSVSQVFTSLFPHSPLLWCSVFTYSWMIHWLGA